MTYCLINTSRSFYFWKASLITCGVLKQNLFFSLKRTFFSKDRLWHLLKNMSSMKHCPWRQEYALCLQSLNAKTEFPLFVWMIVLVRNLSFSSFALHSFWNLTVLQKTNLQVPTSLKLPRLICLFYFYREIFVICHPLFLPCFMN